jgi:hypothetical protein
MLLASSPQAMFDRNPMAFSLSGSCMAVIGC